MISLRINHTLPDESHMGDIIHTKDNINGTSVTLLYRVSRMSLCMSTGFLGTTSDVNVGTSKQ